MILKYYTFEPFKLFSKYFYVLGNSELFKKKKERKF